MTISDQELCNKIAAGDMAAFEAIQKKHKGLIYLISKEEFESGKGDIHEQMSINYEQLIEDVSLIFWQDMYKSITRGISFKNQYSFINLLRTIVKRKTKNLKRKSLSNRTNSFIVGLSNTFVQYDSIPESEVSKSPSLIELSEKESESEEFFNALINKLDSKEKDVFELMQCKYEQDEKPTQEKMGEILGVTSRTIRNRMQSIREKAIRVKSLSEA